MEIRKARKKDIEELTAFYIRMNEVINTRTDCYNPDNDVYPSNEMMAAAIESGGQIVGIEDGIIVMACIVNHECPDEYYNAKWQINASKDEFWVLHALRVAPEYEGRGFAKQMMKFIIDLANKCGQKAIRLDVMEGYSVERLYTQFGFQYIGTAEIFYEDIGYPKRFRLFEKEV